MITFKAQAFERTEMKSWMVSQRTGEGQPVPEGIRAAQDRGLVLLVTRAPQTNRARATKVDGRDEVPVSGGPRDRWKEAATTHHKTLQGKGPADQGVSCKRAPQKIRE